MKLVEKIIRRIKWELNSISWFTADNKRMNESINVSIGVTTFLGRYENCFKKLIEKLAKLFPLEQIVVVANGHFKKDEQLKYIAEITEFCKQFKNVKLITHIEAVGLSKIWNEIIASSDNDKVLILNDDLDINPCFRKDIEKVVGENELIVINRSWSHFIISKKVFSEVGSFDEGLLELGGEDDDYTARCSIAGVEVVHRSIPSVKPKLNESEKKKGMNSYGKIMSSELNGYSTYNSNYLSEKWKTNNTNFEGAVYLPDRTPAYWKLKNKTNNINY